MDIKNIWIELEHVTDFGADVSADNEFCNVSATLDDNRRYAFNVWTFKYLQTAVAECRASGEHLSGLYLLPPDLFVEQVDRQTIEKVLTDWLQEEGRFPGYLEVRDAD